jgi:Ca2+-binding RTX toxin-like protein
VGRRAASVDYSTHGVDNSTHDPNLSPSTCSTRDRYRPRGVGRGDRTPPRRAGTLVGATLLAALAVTIAVALAAPAGSRAPQPIAGDGHGNRLVGGAGADRIAGRGGADRIEGRRGSDVLAGGPGFDRIKGGAGADRISGGPGGAAMVGGPGRDEFNAVDGKPVGGQGRDVIRARDGQPDVINCGPGRDIAYVDRVEEGVFGCERIVQPGTGQKRGGRR